MARGETQKPETANVSGFCVCPRHRRPGHQLMGAQQDPEPYPVPG